MIMPTYPRSQRWHTVQGAGARSVPSLVASATTITDVGMQQGEEACGMPQQTCELQQGWFIRDTEKTLPACLSHLPSSPSLLAG